MAPSVASVHGWLVIDKTAGPSSARVVAHVKRLTGARKAGHAGTLDPFATGVLPVALGEATKTMAHAVDGRKTYRFSVVWGQSRTTDDRTGEVSAETSVRPTDQAIAAALPCFVGRVQQTPPIYSALMVGGERAYALARAGRPVELAPRIVEIHSLQLIESAAAGATLELACGKGTYVRALARDLAYRLGTLAYVSELRRTRVGPFTAAQAISLDNIESLGHSLALEKALLPVEAALAGMPALELTSVQAERLSRGITVELLSIPQGTVCAMVAGRLVALARATGGEVRPLRVFNL
jgi:tRNA pseudouridine55 synthase